MILFIAPFPVLSNEKDGLVQRVRFIDALVEDKPRTYLDISFRRFWKKREHHIDGASIIQANFFVHFFLILGLISRARITYVHSIYNSIKALPAYWLSKVITDLHGVVPEELQYEGKKYLPLVYSLIERIAVSKSISLVYVTNSMKRHIQQKYGRLTSDDRTIAILPKAEGTPDEILGSNRSADQVIYAGGLQAWQNVPLMLEAAGRQDKLSYVFLTGDPDKLQEAIAANSISKSVCFSVSPDAVSRYYLGSTYGFVLRDPVLLNRVACPTKLVEYMYWGVIPIVLTPEIGDFNELGYKHLTLQDFKNGCLPSGDLLREYRDANLNIVLKLEEDCRNELMQLRNRLRGD